MNHNFLDMCLSSGQLNSLQIMAYVTKPTNRPTINDIYTLLIRQIVKYINKHIRSPPI